MSGPVIEIPGNAISKKNSHRIKWKGGKARGSRVVCYFAGSKRPALPFVSSSAAYEAYEEEAKLHLRHNPFIGYAWKYPLVAVFRFYRKTRRKFDMHNMSHGPIDILVEMGILAEDDHHHVRCDFSKSEVFIDPVNPRVEIELIPLEEY